MCVSNPTIISLCCPLFFQTMPQNNFQENFVWITEGLLIFVFGIIGLLGNGISIWTFWRQRVHRIFHNLLLSLAIFDMVSQRIYVLSWYTITYNILIHRISSWYMVCIELNWKYNERLGHCIFNNNFLSNYILTSIQLHNTCM